MLILMEVILEWKYKGVDMAIISCKSVMVIQNMQSNLFSKYMIFSNVHVQKHTHLSILLVAHGIWVKMICIYEHGVYICICKVLCHDIMLINISSWCAIKLQCEYIP